MNAAHGELTRSLSLSDIVCLLMYVTA